MMDVRPIRNEDDLSWALGQIKGYFDTQPEPGSPEADRFDVLAALIENYESRVHSIPDADPVAVLRFAIETLGYTQVDLARLLNSRPRASEILAGKRPLTLDMIRTISAAWRIPVGALVAPTTEAREAA